MREFDWEGRIGALPVARELALPRGAIDALAAHARAVAESDERLHLTSIRSPEEFLHRHVEESLIGASRIGAAVAGPLLDLGSGNGYPGLAIAAVRPRLDPWLAEVSAKKAEFLASVLGRVDGPRGRVLARQVQRPSDLQGPDGTVGPEAIRVLVTRAMGGWQKIVPRLVPVLAPGGTVLVWAGEEMETVRRRTAWSRLEAAGRLPLPGRARSWIWEFRAAAAGPVG